MHHVSSGFGGRSRMLLATVPFWSLGAILGAQESKALLHAPLVVLPVDSAPFQRLGDFDGDGDLDAVGTRIHQNGGNNQVLVWRNDAGQMVLAFQGASTVGGFGGLATPGWRSYAVAVGDLDNDGDDDFVVSGGAATEIFTAQPGFTFTTTYFARTAPVAETIHAVAVGDFDGDSVRDIAVVAKTGPVAIRSGATGVEETFALPAGPTVFTPQDMQLTAVQMDGDLRPELVIQRDAFDYTQALVCRRGTANWTVQAVTTLVLGPEVHWVPGDVDKDGDGDLVEFRLTTPATYVLYQNDGAGNFAAAPARAGGPSEYLADVDGDGDLDGVCCGGGGGPNYVWPRLDFASVFEVAINDGTGTFANAWQMPGAGSESLAGAADLDLDGDLDLVAGRCVFYGRGPWSESPMPAIANANLGFILRQSSLHDFDRDGDVDFLAGPYGGYVNDGNSVYELVSRTVTPPPGTTFGGQWTLDLDGDGARDAIFEERSTTGTFLGMRAVRNNGAGWFTLGGYVHPIRFPDYFGVAFTGYNVDNQFAADFDGDGDEDLVLQQWDTSSFGQSVLLWNVAGTMVLGPTFNGRVAAVADFDGDGIPDVLLHAVSSTYVRRGTGQHQGTFPFLGGLGFGLGVQPNSVAVADFDGDGRLDFTGMDNQGGVYLCRNMGPAGPNYIFSAYSLGISTRTWTPGVTGDLPNVSAGDIDDDGRVDLVVASVPGQPNVGRVLRNLGTFVSGALQFETLQQTMYEGRLADLDGDGDADLCARVVARGSGHFGPSGGMRRQVGTSTIGEAGSRPVWGAYGPFRAGQTERLVLRGVPGPTIAVLGLSLAGAQQSNFLFPGLTLRLDLASLVTETASILGSGDGRAAASAEFPLTLPPGLQGLEFHSQAFVFDAAAPFGLTCTNALVQRIGN